MSINRINLSTADDKSVVEAYKDTRKDFRNAEINSDAEKYFNKLLMILYKEICKRHLNILQY